jgi:TetR/AcrR family transcriptional regulator, transcriptional repressor for nem operon
MRYDPDHKERTRGRLLKVAAEQIRLRGPEGVSVAGIMKRLGLTHGGFYAHFDSKDALLAAAVRAMFEDAARRRAKSCGCVTSIEMYVDLYVSETHRDNPALGCPVPALMSESTRWPRAARQAFHDGVAQLAHEVAAFVPPHTADREGAGMALLAQMAGAVALSRTVADRAASDLLLETAREALKQRYGRRSGRGAS